MELTANIASRLARKLESTQPYDVIIINKSGIIIGASNPVLIGQRNSDAYERINEYLRRAQSGNTTRIREQGSGRCLFVNNQLVGAVGLIGKERQVVSYLEMVKTISEMFLEKEFEIQGQVIRNASISQVLMRLVSKHTDPDRLETVLASHGLDLSIPRTLLAIQFEPIAPKTDSRSKHYSMLFKNAVNNMLSILENRFSFSGDMILPDPEKAVMLVFCADRSPSPSQHILRLEQLCHLLIEDAKTNYQINAKAIIGNRCHSLSDYDSQYSVLMDNFELATKFFSDQLILHSKNLIMGNVISYIPETVRDHIVHHVLNNLLASTLKDQYLDTLEAFFFHNMNIGETAESLKIHRNTLQYRLKKIEELTGYGTYCLDHILTLHLAYVLYKMGSP